MPLESLGGGLGSEVEGCWGVVVEVVVEDIFSFLFFLRVFLFFG